MPCGYVRGISPAFAGLSPAPGQVAYVLLTRAPVAGGRVQALSPAAPRLACVKPAASVHPEPGSNSPLFMLLLFFSQKSTTRRSSLRFVVPARPIWSELKVRVSDGTLRFLVPCLPFVWLSCRNLSLFSATEPWRMAPWLRLRVQSYCF